MSFIFIVLGFILGFTLGFTLGFWGSYYLTITINPLNHLSPIIDFHTREVLAYDISEKPDMKQIWRMLDSLKNVHKDRIKGMILHSDQGYQYQLKAYHSKLKELEIIQSMSRKGNCLDNAVMENFFGKMKNEMFYGHEYEFESLDQLEKEMREYIVYYNEKRIKTKLKGLTPLQFRYQSLQLV